MKRCILSFSIILYLCNVQITFAAAPTQQARDIVFSSIAGTSMTITWTNGNGSSRCVFIKQTSNVELAVPVNGTNYTANTIFGSGTQIGSTAWYCIYKSTGNTVTVTGLSPNQMYRIHVLEFNTTPSNPTFLFGSGTSGNPRFQNTGPTSQVTNIAFSNVATTSMNVSMTPGNGNNRVVFRTTNLLAADLTIGNGTSYTVGNTYSNWLCVYNGAGNSFSETGLVPVTAYKYRVFEYSDNASATIRRIYLSSTATNNPNTQSTADFQSPTIQATALSFTGITQNSFNVSWTPGNGTESIVFVAHTSSGESLLVNNTTYNADANFLSGDQADAGWYCVYRGSGSSVEVFNLSGYTTYRVMVYSFNGVSGLEKYNVSTASGNPANVYSSSSKVWNGSSWDGGTPSGADDAEISADYNNVTDITCANLIVNTGFTLNIQAGSTVTVNSDITNYGIINLLSPANSGASGSLINLGAINNFGSMNLQRYISPGTLDATNYHWHFMSSPVNSILAESVFRGDYGYSYAESSNSWASLTQFGANLGVGQGYMIKTLAAKTVAFSGTFNTGDISVGVTNTGPDANHGYNLVGNPYTSAIDWNAGGWAKTNIGSTFWIWDPNNERYMSFNGSVGTNGGSRYIPSMQGFFVKVNDGSANGTLGFSNSIRLHNGQSYQKSASQQPELIRLETSNSNNKSDEIVIYFNEGENDGLKFFSMNAAIPQIYAIDDTTKLSIFKIDPSSFVDSKEIPLAFVCKQNGEYTINAKELTFNSNIDIKLVDNISSDTIDLRKQSNYKFNYTTNETGSRFSLLLNAKTVVKIANVSKPVINVWGNNKKLFVNLPFEGNSTLEIYNLEGKKLNFINLKDKGLHTINLNKDGLYLIRVIHNNISYASKVFIQ